MVNESNDRGIASVTAAVLRRGKMLHQVSLILGAFAGAVFLYKGGPCPLFVLLLGAAELWFAARVALDADLFAGIADGKLEAPQLDDSLHRLGLRKTAGGVRSMEDRSRGALRLLKLQALCLLAQVAAFAACLAIFSQGVF